MTLSTLPERSLAANSDRDYKWSSRLLIMTEPRAEHGAEASGATIAGAGVAHAPSVVRPVVVTEPFYRSETWDKRIFHFENIAEVNKRTG